MRQLRGRSLQGRGPARQLSDLQPGAPLRRRPPPARTATDQVCAQCSASYYLDNSACVACNGSCPAGQYIAHSLFGVGGSGLRRLHGDQRLSGRAAHLLERRQSAVRQLQLWHLPGQRHGRHLCAVHPGRRLYLDGDLHRSERLAVFAMRAPGSFFDGTQCRACGAPARRESTKARPVWPARIASARLAPRAVPPATAPAPANAPAVRGSSYLNGSGACVACTAACGPGTHESTACTGSTDRVCTPCTPVSRLQRWPHLHHRQRPTVYDLHRRHLPGSRHHRCLCHLHRPLRSGHLRGDGLHQHHGPGLHGVHPDRRLLLRPDLQRRGQLAMHQLRGRAVQGRRPPRHLSGLQPGAQLRRGRHLHQLGRSRSVRSATPATT